MCPFERTVVIFWTITKNFTNNGRGLIQYSCSNSPENFNFGLISLLGVTLFSNDQQLLYQITRIFCAVSVDHTQLCAAPRRAVCALWKRGLIGSPRASVEICNRAKEVYRLGFQLEAKWVPCLRRGKPYRFPHFCNPKHAFKTRFNLHFIRRMRGMLRNPRIFLLVLFPRHLNVEHLAVPNVHLRF